MSARTPSTTRRRWIGWAVLVLLLLLVALAVLAIPLLRSKTDATAARDDLRAALTSLEKQDYAAARTHLQSARSHVDAAQGPLDGLPGQVWGHVPVAGGAVDDADHLVAALGDVTTVAEKTLGFAPQLQGDSTFVDGETIRLDKLQPILDEVSSLGPYVDDAVAELDAVRADTPLVGGWIGRTRDAALAQALPIQHSYDASAPALLALPRVLGGDGTRTYLVTFLNPAELRYSGGATLSLTTVTLRNGTATFGKPYNVDDVLAIKPTVRWPKVSGNPFHGRGGSQRLTTATFTPYWSVGGEELLRAWQATVGQHCDGVIALDTTTLARLMGITGPVQVPGYGELSQGNLTRTLAGSYDRFDDIERRHALNNALVPIFRDKLLHGGRFLQKVRSLTESAQGRHFVTYFRDRADQKAFADLGTTGDLAATPHDYLGVFTQNFNGSKGDFWQRRTVSSDVRLAADGSAKVDLTVVEKNPSPPYTQTTPDPHRGYFTRWLQNNIGVFLPRGVQPAATAEVDGRPEKFHGLQTHSPGTYHRKYRQLTVTIPPRGSVTLQTSYVVPGAAIVDGDSLTYDLTLDPQGMVVPQQTRVVVHPPTGYEVADLPDGWTRTGDGASVRVAATATMHWQVRFVKAG